MRPFLMVPPLALALSLGLAACSPETPTQEPEGPPAMTPGGQPPAGEEPGPVTPPPPSVNGVNLTTDINLLGTEPFWAVEIRRDQIKLTGVDRPEVTAPNRGVDAGGDRATWTTEAADGTPLVINVTEGPCSDGMSDRQYPLTAEVRFGQETLRGCGATTAFILGTDEQGRPRQG
ncbi:hypothetical protein Q0812_08070 [Brevundimonas sp. 2R-24]|uniref:Uncharacterized protein n=1 Tax=Peiella sedimenti TaxID=3061083 RepID=A0ABT8SNI6_9CAUL|nr:hypothetical protein [Caulobacteraceae bacterium XZ-24]